MENITKSNRYGFELEAEAQLPYAITFGGNVSQTWEEYYMENEEGDLEKQPAKHSPVRANLNLKWHFLNKRGWIGTSVQYSDVFIIEMGGKDKKGGEGPPPENIVVDAWKTVDFYAGFNIYKKNFISVGVTNAFDEEYSHYSPIYQPGRSINVSLKGGF